MQLQTEVSQLSPTAAVMTLRGRLIMGSQLSVLQGQITGLVDGGSRKLLLDITEVEYLDSASLGLLIHTAATLRNMGGELRLAAPNERVVALFKLTGTDAMLKVYPDKGSALDGFEA